MDKRRGNSKCAGVGDGVAYASEVADVDKAVLRNRGDLIRQREIRVKNKTKVAGRGNGFENYVRGNKESRVVDFR